MTENRTRIELSNNTIKFFTAGLEGFVDISIQRTYRVPDDSRSHDLPPSLGAFPMLQVSEVAHKLPKDMIEKGGVLLPIYPFEALWFKFEGRSFRPSALQILAGKINAISGSLWDGLMTRSPNQDYVVVGGPKESQPWLDGWKTENGITRQFIAATMGRDQTVEFQKTGKETEGGIQLLLIEADLNSFPREEWTLANNWPSSNIDNSPYEATRSFGGVVGGGASYSMRQPKGIESMHLNASMGLGAGGMINQKVYPDPYNIVWDSSLRQKIWIHLINPKFWEQITGRPCPISPITPEYYKKWGVWTKVSTWFHLHDEHKGDVGGSGLADVRSVQSINQQQGGGHIPAQTGPETPENTIHLPSSFGCGVNEIPPGKF